MRTQLKASYYRTKKGALFYGHYLLSRMPSQLLRHAVYRWLGMKIGEGSIVYGRVEIRYPRGISIGPHSSIGHESILDGRGGLTIGASVNLSTGVWIWTGQHDVQSPSFAATFVPVTIGDYAWLGGRVIIMPGVSVGKGAVVASGAVVTKNVEEYTIVAGIPARPIGVRNRDLAYRLGSLGPFM